ncbi:hypothetical protein M3Y94_00474200 [Aphelenchoides besseyi]|nr:hypothetical protein M3Y94_00474200 [Aphelenchoides besseyi]KAI6219942.1 hypothetical protein M3Y95_01081000 [Aphelenchoides besseyi]
MSAPVAAAATVDCSDLADFQRVLNKLRGDEDRVVLKLNCALPTKSFHKDAVSICDRFQQELSELRRLRYNIMYNCMRENQQVVNLKKETVDADERIKLQNAMTNLRFIRNEQTVDTIITEQTDKAVHERCRKAAINS